MIIDQKYIKYKGKGEHSVNELEIIIEQREEELHLIKSEQNSEDEMEWEIGNRVRITKNRSYHGYKIGDEVEITAISNEDGYYYTTQNHKHYWWVKSDEVELIEK